MTQVMMNQVLGEIVNGLASFLAIGVLFLIKQGYGYLQKAVGIKKLQQVQTLLSTQKGIVSEVVMYVEHKVGGGNGAVKFKLATDAISKEFGKLGIKVDDAKTEQLIESALKTFELQFGDQWSSVVKQGDVKSVIQSVVANEEKQVENIFSSTVQKVITTSV